MEGHSSLLPIDCKIRHDSFNGLSVRDDSEHLFKRAMHIDTTNRMARLLDYEDTFEMFGMVH